MLEIDAPELSGWEANSNIDYHLVAIMTATEQSKVVVLAVISGENFVLELCERFVAVDACHTFPECN